MATLLPGQEEEEQGFEQAMRQMLSTGGVGTSLGSSGGAAGSPMMGGAPGGSSFADISRFVDTNRPATERLGENIAGQVEQSGQRARDTLDEQFGAFGDLVGENTVTLGSDVLTGIRENPTSIAGNEQQRDAVVRARDAQYQGPNAFEETDLFGEVASAFGDANRDRELSRTAQGQTQLADRTVQEPRSAGVRNFDQALVGGNQTSRERITSAAAGLSDLGPMMQERSEQGRQMADQARQTTDQTREQTRGALTESNQALQDRIDERVEITRQQAEQRAQAAREALQREAAPLPTAGLQGRQDPRDLGQGGGAGQQLVIGSKAGVVPHAFDKGFVPDGRTVGDLAGGFGQFLDQREQQMGLDPQVMQDLGVTPEQWQQLNELSFLQPLYQYAQNDALNPYRYVSDFEAIRGPMDKYLTTQSPEAAITKGNVATAEDYDFLEALNQLSGQQNTYLDPTQREVAGTASTDLVDFDLDSYANQVLSARRALGDTAARQGSFNARSGGDSFLKKAGRATLNASLGTDGDGNLKLPSETVFDFLGV